MSDKGTRMSDKGTAMGDKGAATVDKGAAMSDKGAKMGDKGTRMSDKGAKMSDKGTAMSDKGAKMGDKGTRMSDKGTRMNDKGAKMSDKGTRMSDKGTRMNDKGAAMSDKGAKMSDKGTATVDKGAKMGDKGAKMGDKGTAMSDKGAAMSDKGAKMSDKGTRMSDKGAAMSDKGAKMSDKGAAMSDKGAKMSDKGTAMSDKGAAMSDKGTRMNDKGTAMSDKGAKMGDAQAGAIVRCPWCRDDEDYMRYHDDEWGVPVRDGNKLFEALVLDGAQAGLSWITILRRRNAYRAAFDNFDAEKIARYTEADVARLMGNAAIVRNRLKIASAIGNARAFLKFAEKGASFADWLWDFVDGAPIVNAFASMREVPSSTPLSQKISTELKSRGWSFVGPTIVYAFMQASGLVNDHLVDCFRYDEASSSSFGSARFKTMPTIAANAMELKRSSVSPL
jgi:DNA-3-methyladenine glycosylase I